MDPTACEGILFGHSRHGGVSRGGRGHLIRFVVARLDLDTCGAVGITGLVGCVTVGTADWWVGAGRAILQAGMVLGWSLVLWSSAQTAQQDRFLHRAAGCP